MGGAHTMQSRQFPKAQLAALLLLILCAALAAGAQDLASSVQLRDVPFQATEVVTRETSAGTTITRGRMARDRTGSTYVEMVDPKTGVATTAFLLDVPGHRGIILDLVHKRYRIRPAPGLTSREPAPTAVPELLETATRTQGHSETELRNGIPCTVTHLGAHLVSGLIAVGSTETWPRHPDQLAPPHELERWFSVELGLLVRMTEFDRPQGQRTEVGLTEILRAEPNPALFQIPPDFRAEQEPATAPGVLTPGRSADGD